MFLLNAASFNNIDGFIKEGDIRCLSGMKVDHKFWDENSILGAGGRGLPSFILPSSAPVPAKLG